MKLGVTAGWGRTGEEQDYDLAHGRPQQLWVKELARGALRRLRAVALPAAWAVVEEAAAPGCQASAAQVRRQTPARYAAGPGTREPQARVLDD